MTGLIGFQEFVPKNAPKKRSSSAKKRKKAEILFGDKVEDDVAKVAVKTKIRKKDASRPKKKQKKSKGEDFSLTEEDKAVSTEDYKFKHDLSGWRRFNIDKRLLRGIDALGLVNPTEIQRRSIPAGINSKSTILGAAETGSGKTLAYALPILHKLIGWIDKYGQDGIDTETPETPSMTLDDEGMESFIAMKEAEAGPKCLILCPTRELAVQVHNAIRHVSKFTQVNTAVIVGGVSSEKQG